MKKRCIIASEVLMHDTFVNDDLLLEGAVCSVVVEFECLDELVLVVGIVLEGLDDWHATLVCLDDLHGQVFHKVVVIFCNQVRLDDDSSSLVFIVL